MLEVEQRLTVGTVQILHAVPVNSLFFGGNRQQTFIPGDTWSIHANPYVRSIPSNRYYRTRDGAGAERFISYNATVAITAWREPLVPLDLSNDSGFQKKMNGALVSATSTLEVSYASSDSNFRDVQKILPAIASKLWALRDIAGPLPSSESCTETIDTVLLDVRTATEKKPASAYGYVKEFLPGGDDDLAALADSCKSEPGTAAVIAAADDVVKLARQLHATFLSIDQVAAGKKAENDMRYIRRTLDIIVKDLNVASVSPVFVFDVAQVGPRDIGPYSGTRFGVGGGIRFSLANTVKFSGGYSVNPTRQPGEPAGAVFISLSTRSPF